MVPPSSQLSLVAACPLASTGTVGLANILSTTRAIAAAGTLLLYKLFTKSACSSVSELPASGRVGVGGVGRDRKGLPAPAFSEIAASGEWRVPAGTGGVGINKAPGCRKRELRSQSLELSFPDSAT